MVRRSVGCVDVARVHATVGVVPYVVCSPVVLPEGAFLAEASVGVVNVGEVAGVPFTVRGAPKFFCPAVVIRRGWVGGGGVVTSVAALDFGVTNLDGRRD